MVRLRVASLASAALLLLSPMYDGIAEAAPSSCGTHETNFEGYQSFPTGTFLNGIEVVLKLRPWGYCTSVSHTNSEWVMIAPDGSNGNQNG